MLMPIYILFLPTSVHLLKCNNTTQLCDTGDEMICLGLNTIVVFHSIDFKQHYTDFYW